MFYCSPSNDKTHFRPHITLVKVPLQPGLVAWQGTYQSIVLGSVYKTQLRVRTVKCQLSVRQRKDNSSIGWLVLYNRVIRKGKNFENNTAALANSMSLEKVGRGLYNSRSHWKTSFCTATHGILTDLRATCNPLMHPPGLCVIELVRIFERNKVYRYKYEYELLEMGAITKCHVELYEACRVLVNVTLLVHPIMHLIPCHFIK